MEQPHGPVHPEAATDLLSYWLEQAKAFREMLPGEGRAGFEWMASWLAVDRFGPPESKRGRKESSGMHARITTLEAPPEKMDDATRYVQEQLLPQLRQMDGFEGFVALGDRQSGKLLGVAFWESEEAMRATEEAVSGMRSGSAEATEATVSGVERYEVAVFEAPSGGPVSGVTDTVGGVTDSVRGVADNLLGGEGKQQR